MLLIWCFGCFRLTLFVFLLNFVWFLVCLRFLGFAVPTCGFACIVVCGFSYFSGFGFELVGGVGVLCCAWIYGHCSVLWFACFALSRMFWIVFGFARVFCYVWCF